jgi:hypothetical protein
MPDTDYNINNKKNKQNRSASTIDFLTVVFAAVDAQYLVVDERSGNRTMEAEHAHSTMTSSVFLGSQNAIATIDDSLIRQTLHVKCRAGDFSQRTCAIDHSVASIRNVLSESHVTINTRMENIN